MTISRKIAIIAGIVLLVALLVVIRIAYVQQKALATADAVTKADQATIGDYQKAISARDAADAVQQKNALAAEAKVKTSADAVKVITEYLPASGGEPQWDQIVTKDDFTQLEQAKLPASPSYVVETQDQATKVAGAMIGFDSCKQSLQACKLDQFDLQMQLKTQTAETDTWKAAAKGGTKTHRFLKFVECAAVAGGASYATAAATGQPKWAGVGAAAGVAACQLF